MKLARPGAAVCTNPAAHAPTRRACQGRWEPCPSIWRPTAWIGLDWLGFFGKLSLEPGKRPPPLLLKFLQLASAAELALASNCTALHTAPHYTALHSSPRKRLLLDSGDAPLSQWHPAGQPYPLFPSPASLVPKPRLPYLPALPLQNNSPYPRAAHVPHELGRRSVRSSPVCAAYQAPEAAVEPSPPTAASSHSSSSTAPTATGSHALHDRPP